MVSRYRAFLASGRLVSITPLTCNQREWGGVSGVEWMEVAMHVCLGRGGDNVGHGQLLKLAELVR